MDGSAFIEVGICINQRDAQAAPCGGSLRRRRSRSAPRRRVWYVSPEGFRELRRSCLLSRTACAGVLGCSVSAVRAWDRGRNRVPWSAVKLLRLLRLGDLGTLRREWHGWTLNRNGIVSPEGVAYSRGDLGWWSLTCRQAEAFRQARQKAAVRPSGGADRQAATIPTDGGRFAYEAGRQALTPRREALSPLPVPAERRGSGSGVAGRPARPGVARCGAGALAASPRRAALPAGLVSSQKQVTQKRQKPSRNAACSGGAR